MTLELEEIQLTETPEDINPFVEKFLSKFGGYVGWADGYHHPVPSNYLNHINNTHQNIRKLIGGIHQTYEINTDDIQGIADQERCKYIIARIKALLPHYLADHRLTDENLLVPNLPNGMRVGKHINTYAARKLTIEQKEELHKLISQLGEEWNRVKAQKQKIWCTINTSLRAFCALGHYGPDNQSCFKQSGGNAYHKYNLAKASDTFVVLLRQRMARTPEPIDSPLVLARLWGFYKPDNNTLNFCNYYSKPGFPIGVTKAALDLLTKELFHTDEIKCHDNKIALRGLDVFHNHGRAGQLNLTYSVDKDIQTQTLTNG